MRQQHQSSASRAARGLGAAGLLFGLASAALAQPPVRVAGLGDTLIVRRCAASSCEVIAELPRGQAVSVLTTSNGWHRVMVTLPGSRATTGWVEAAHTQVVRAEPAPRPAQVGSLPERGSGASASATPSDCLTCVATRTPTADEWAAAMKALPAPGPAPTATPAPAPSATPRAEVVRRDGRTSVERMRDEIDARFGEELKRLSAAAVKADDVLQTYMGACYEKYQPIQVLPPGATPPGGTPPPVRPRASILELWRGRPVWAWNDTWSRPAGNVESTAFCEGLWNDVSGRAAEVRAGLDRIEADARSSDIYPGVVRDAFRAYGLADGK
jgi:hypothetical protein